MDSQTSTPPLAKESMPPPVEGDGRSVFRRLFDLSLPVMGLNLLNVLSLAVDTAMCGRLPNKEDALNALGFATQVIFFAMVLMMGVLVGAVAFVSRAHGAGDDERVEHLLKQSTQLTLFVAALVAALGNLAAPLLLRLLGADDSVMNEALAYLRPMLACCAFLYLTMLYAAVLRGVGNTRLPFQIGLISNGLNVLFNYGLILGNFGLPSMGVGGAAIGTVMSQFFGLLLLIVLLRRGAVPGIRPTFKPAPVDFTLAKDLARVGAPAALDMVILNAGFASIVGMLGRMHPLAVAAHGVGIRLQAIAFVPGLGVSQATGAMVGNALGAADPQQARRVARSAMLLCTVIMSAIAIFMLIFAVDMVAIFEIAPGSDLSNLAVLWIRILGVGMPIIGIHIALMGVLRGAGATKQSLISNIIGTVIQIPASFVLGYTLGYGPLGIWAGFPLSFAVKAGISALFYRDEGWQRTGVAID